MKQKRFTEEQIIKALKEVDGGAEVRDVCRRLGVSEQSFYRWRRKFGGLEVSDAKRLRELEERFGHRRHERDDAPRRFVEGEFAATDVVEHLISVYAERSEASMERRRRGISGDKGSSAGVSPATAGRLAQRSGRTRRDETARRRRRGRLRYEERHWSLASLGMSSTNSITAAVP
jgi:hypothetical protein